MDWDAVIDKHREALKRVLAALVGMAGVWDGQQADGIPDCPLPTADCLTLPRHLHRAILRLLRPAEAAARRLVIVVARGFSTMPPRLSSPVSAGEAQGRVKKPKAVTRRGGRIAFPLFDPPRRWRPHRPRPAGVPRIWFTGAGEPFPVHPPSPLDDIDATRLALRLAALSRALDDLPAQARRFARWRASRAQSPEIRKSRRVWPLRAGRPPGQRPANNRRAVHEVHEILRDLHGLAFDVLECPDTS